MSHTLIKRSHTESNLANVQVRVFGKLSFIDGSEVFRLGTALQQWPDEEEHHPVELTSLLTVSEWFRLILSKHCFVALSGSVFIFKGRTSHYFVLCQREPYQNRREVMQSLAYLLYTL